MMFLVSGTLSKGVPYCWYPTSIGGLSITVSDGFSFLHAAKTTKVVNAKKSVKRLILIQQS
jgi:hypothetical protein